MRKRLATLQAVSRYAWQITWRASLSDVILRPEYLIDRFCERGDLRDDRWWIRCTIASDQSHQDAAGCGSRSSEHDRGAAQRARSRRAMIAYGIHRLGIGNDGERESKLRSPLGDRFDEITGLRSESMGARSRLRRVASADRPDWRSIRGGASAEITEKAVFVALMVGRLQVTSVELRCKIPEPRCNEGTAAFLDATFGRAPMP